MRSKHTHAELSAAIDTLAELAGDDVAALVLNHLELSRHVSAQLMEREVTDLAGERHSHDKPHEGRYSRWGRNPGSLAVGGQKLPVAVPRVYDAETGKTFSPQIYHELRQAAEPPAYVIESLFRGLGSRNLALVTEALIDSFGLSKSRVSELFVEHSAAILEEFLQRRLDESTYVAVFIDGKCIQGQNIVSVIGVTEAGEKYTLALTQCTTENAGAITTMFRNMISRGFCFDDGMLFVIDGGLGLRKAIDEVFGEHAVIQRCQVHKLRNVLDHLPENARPEWRKLLKQLFSCDDYTQARAMADELNARLQKINSAAAASLYEGLEEVLTLTRLGLRSVFGRSFGTTNVIESANSSIARRTRHVTRWSTGDQRLRWSALALLDAEQSWRRVHNYKRLPMLQRAIKDEVNNRIQSNQPKAKVSRFSTKKRT